MSSRVSKQELQDRLEAKEEEIRGLRDELSGHALRVGDLESELASVQAENDTRLDEEKVANVVEDLAITINGLSRMLVYANSVALSILTYRGPDPERVSSFASALVDDLAPFLQESLEGQFQVENILDDVQAELTGDVAVDLSDLLDIKDLLADVYNDDLSGEASEVG